jgi:hypothetical protein
MLSSVLRSGARARSGVPARWLARAWGFSPALRLCLVALWLAACAEPKSAPPAPPPEPVDGGTGEQDAEPPPPIDCHNSMGSQDADGDGFSRAKGDCDDCTGAFGPAAIDVPGNGMDEDCDGADATGPSEPCDEELEPSSTDAEEAASALGLCEHHTKDSRLPGLIEARWLRLSDGEGLGDARQVWLPERFGTLEPREGSRLLVLSTGVARDINDDDYTPGCDTLGSTRPAGEPWTGGREPPENYPKDSSQCDDDVNSSELPAYNDVVLELTLRVPSNARSFAFDSLFFTYEYPDYLCSPFNDFYVVFVDPAPDDLEDDNVLFDAEGDPVGVNSGLLSVCREAERGRTERPVECALGPALLAETGFDEDEATCAAEQTDKRDIGGASTGWLHTVVPVSPGKVVTVKIMLWDQGDPLLDSTVVLDNFQWSPEMLPLGTGPISSG